MKPTEQQQDLINGMSSGSGNVAGVARAGTGKTATFAMGADQVDPLLDVTACAFNRDIVKVMLEKLPKHWRIKTMNGLGYGSLYRLLDRKLRIEEYKMRNIIREIPGSSEFPDFSKATGIVKAWGVAPRGALADPRSMFEDTTQTYHDLFDKYDIDVGLHPNPIGAIRQALLVSIQQAWQGVLDFDDQLYLAYIYKAALPRADLVLIDEAQDISPIQRGLLWQMLKPEGRLIAIGDDRQAIYGFRGADRESLPKIIQEFSCEPLPLTMSFRCSQAVIERAQKFVPDITAWDQAPEGSVTVEKEMAYKEFPRNAAILCRNNAPLMSACLGFIKQGIGATMLGREVVVGLQQLIDKQRADTLVQLSNNLWQDVDHRVRLLEQRDKQVQADNLKDKAECIQVLIEYLGKNNTVRALKEKLNNMFSEQRGVITLSTIHKSKGLEWPTVFILDRELMPSRWAKTEEQILQENNLHYVAITRAQVDLVYINSEGLK
jgi:hypothetical protein